jgi:hypothetical protein
LNAFCGIGWGRVYGAAHDGDDLGTDTFLLSKKLLSQSFIESNVKVPVEEFKVHDVMRNLVFYILRKGCGKCHVKQLHLY